MSDDDFRRFIRLVLAAACEVQRLVWALGISDGTVSVGFHGGRAAPLRLDVSRWVKRQRHQPQESGPGSPGADCPRTRFDLVQIRAKVEAILLKMAGHGVFWLGGRPFDLSYGRIDFTVRCGVVRDFVVARRILLDDLEGLDPLAAAG
jgi:hypothetical protein